MKHVDIAKKNNVTRGYVSSVLAGKSHSMSEKAVQIIVDAADAHAEKQKAKFIADVMYRFQLAQTRKMNLKNKKNIRYL